MAFDVFLKIDGIPGESMDDKHKDWIQILSYSMGITHPGIAGPAGGAAAQARAAFQDFSIVKPLDKSSPKLALACAQGSHVKDIKLEICHAGGDKFKFMEYWMLECIVSSYKPGGSAKGTDAIPIEEVAFNFHKIQYTYSQQKRPDGSGGGNVISNWDLTQNKGS
jgi:type VI secretion system secreted protein Hcp